MPLTSPTSTSLKDPLRLTAQPADWPLALTVPEASIHISFYLSIHLFCSSSVSHRTAVPPRHPNLPLTLPSGRRSLGLSIR